MELCIDANILCPSTALSEGSIAAAQSLQGGSKSLASPAPSDFLFCSYKKTRFFLRNEAVSRERPLADQVSMKKLLLENNIVHFDRSRITGSRRGRLRSLKGKIKVLGVQKSNFLGI